MQVFVFVVSVGLLAALSGWSVGRSFRKDQGVDGHRSDLLGFAALGMIVGLALGLSASPVLAGAITAGFALVGVLLPIYLPKNDPAASPPPRPIPAGVWLFPFATAAALGMILGIALRVNDALDFRNDNLRDEFLNQGFTPRQTEEIMDRLARSIRDAPTTAAALQSPQMIQGSAKPTTPHRAETGLQSDDSQGVFDWKDFWDRLNKSNLTASRKLQEFKNVAPAPIADEVKKLEEQGAESILKIVRGQHPEIGG